MTASDLISLRFYNSHYMRRCIIMPPFASTEEKGWWVGVATHVCDALTYKVLTKHNKVIYRSDIRSALDPAKRNQHLSLLGGEMASTYLGGNMCVW
jgi:hypothetical protein